MSKLILKVLVGSQAHGLADENSDHDYRGVFQNPTRESFDVFYKPRNTHWLEDKSEGKEDNTTWELKYFLEMAVKCNSTIMEVFHAPVIEANEVGKELLNLFPKIWNTKDLIRSHLGYATNQRKKFLDNKELRMNKYAASYIRTLFQCFCFLENGEYPVDMSPYPIVYSFLKRIREGDYEPGEIIDQAFFYESVINNTEWKQKETDIQSVNNFLRKVRIEDLRRIV